MNNENRNRAGHAHPAQGQTRSAPVPQQRRTASAQTQTTRAVTVKKTEDKEKKLAKIAKKENKLIQAEQKKREAAVAEAKWQNGIVRVRGGIDGTMLTIILILVAFGSIAVFSASYPEAVRKEGDGMVYIIKQIQFVLMGLAAMTFMIFFPIRWYRKWAPVLAYGIAVILLVITPFVGTSEGVTTRWIDVGPFNVQPSEVMKLAIILMLAWYIDKYDDLMNDSSLPFGTQYKWNTFFPIAILGFACILVLVGKHLSGTIIVGMIGLLMLLVGGCNMKWLFATGTPIAAVVLPLFLVLNPYAWKRLTTFADDNADTLDELYQTTQSIYAIGSGGLFGVGIGESRQKFSYLSAAHTDFIFAIWCEEWGFLGALVLILLFLLFLWRGYVIALRAPDKFTMLTAFGITTHVGIQAFFNMCVVADMFPNTGITLPFFSYGGSSLIVLLFEMGILLAISRQYYRKKSELRRK